MARYRPSPRFEFGNRDGFDWLITTATLHDLLTMCPEVVCNKFLAVTSFDSGCLDLTPQEVASGWHSAAGIAYSPRIEVPLSLPYDNYDEWYVFPAASKLLNEGLPSFQVFVNFQPFAVKDECRPDLVEQFWRQLSQICPETYVSEGAFLNFVTSNRILFARVRDVLSQTL